MESYLGKITRFFKGIFAADSGNFTESKTNHLTTKNLASKLKNKGLSRYLDRLEGVARPCIRLYLSQQDEDEIRIGCSKIGGRPDLPPSIKWPYETERPPNNRDRFFNQTPKTRSLLPLSLVAQLDLAEISVFDEENLLPPSGWLYFFYSNEQDVWGFDPRDASGFKVIYFDGDRSALTRRDYPELLSEYSRFSSCSVVPVPELNLPNLWSDRMAGFFNSEYDRDAYNDLRDDGLVNKMLGYADAIQGEMEIECEMVTRGHYIGDGVGAKDPRRTSSEAALGDWILLLQVDSNEECGMMWGDVGRIYFWIRREDILERRFEKTWFVYQCC